MIVDEVYLASVAAAAEQLVVYLIEVVVVAAAAAVESVQVAVGLPVADSAHL